MMDLEVEGIPGNYLDLDPLHTTSILNLPSTIPLKGPLGPLYTLLGFPRRGTWRLTECEHLRPGKPQDPAFGKALRAQLPLRRAFSSTAKVLIRKAQKKRAFRLSRRWRWVQ